MNTKAQMFPPETLLQGMLIPHNSSVILRFYNTRTMQQTFLWNEHYRLFIKMSIKKEIYYLIVISVCFHVITILYEEIMLQIKNIF